MCISILSLNLGVLLSSILDLQKDQDITNIKHKNKHQYD